MTGSDIIGQAKIFTSLLLLTKTRNVLFALLITAKAYDVVALAISIAQLKQGIGVVLRLDGMQKSGGLGLHAAPLIGLLHLPGEVVVGPVDVGLHIGYAIGDLHLKVMGCPIYSVSTFPLL